MKLLMRRALLLALGLATGCQTVGDTPPSEANISSEDWLTAKAEIYRELALRSLRGGDPERTRRLLTEAVQFEEGDVQSIQLLARMNLSAGKLLEAKSCADWWLRLQPESVQALCLSGIVEESLGNIAAAEARFREAIAVDRTQVMPHVDLHTFLLNHGREAEAQGLREEMSVRFPECHEIHVDHGAFLENQGDWNQALVSFERAREIKPRDLKLATRVGTAALMLDEGQRLEDLERELPPHARLEDASLTLVLAAGRLRTGDQAGVLEDLDLLTGQARRDPVVSLLRAEILLAQKDLSGAETAFRAALSQDDQLARAHSGLGRVHLMRGQPDAARRSLQRCVEIDPRGVESRALYAACLAQSGDWERAREHYVVARESGLAPRLLTEIERRYPRLVEEPQTSQSSEESKP